MSLKKVVALKVIENRLTMLNFLILEWIFGDFLKLLYELKYHINIIASKNSDVKMIAVDFQVA